MYNKASQTRGKEGRQRNQYLILVYVESVCVRAIRHIALSASVPRVCSAAKAESVFDSVKGVFQRRMVRRGR